MPPARATTTLRELLRTRSFVYMPAVYDPIDKSFILEELGSLKPGRKVLSHGFTDDTGPGEADQRDSFRQFLPNGPHCLVDRAQTGTEILAAQKIELSRIP